MEQARLERLAPVTGIIAVVLVVAGGIIGMSGSPDFVGSPASFLRYYTEHKDDIMLGAVLGIFSVFFFLWFAGSLRTFLRNAEGGDWRVTQIGFAGAVVGAAGVLAGMVTWISPALRLDERGKLSAEVATVFGDLSNMFLGVAAPLGFSVLLAATAVLGFRHRAVPVWWSGLSALGALVMFLPFIAWIGLFIFPVWVLVMSVLLLRQTTSGTPLAP